MKESPSSLSLSSKILRGIGIGAMVISPLQVETKELLQDTVGMKQLDKEGANTYITQNEWIQSPEIQEDLCRIASMIPALGSELYKEREKAQKQIQVLISDLIKRCPPISKDIEEVLSFRESDFEIQMRKRRIMIESIPTSHKTQYLPPQEKVSAKDILRDIKMVAGLTIKLDSDVIVTIQQTENTISDVLYNIASAARCQLVADPINAHTIHITNSENFRTLMLNDSLLASQHIEDDIVDVTVMSIDPDVKIQHVGFATSSGTNDINITHQGSKIETGNHDFCDCNPNEDCCGKECRTNKKEYDKNKYINRFSTTNANQNKSMQFKYIQPRINDRFGVTKIDGSSIKTEPLELFNMIVVSGGKDFSETTVPLVDAENGSIKPLLRGRQTLVQYKQKNEDGTWDAVLIAHGFGTDLSWGATSVAEDHFHRPMSLANEYTFLDKEGNEILQETEKTHFIQRRMIKRVKLKEEPHDVRMRVATDLLLDAFVVER